MNLPDKEKSVSIKLQEDHLEQAKAERELYRNASQEAEDNFATIREQYDFTENYSACSLNKAILYFFDYVQKVHMPKNQWCNQDFLARGTDLKQGILCSVDPVKE